MVSMSVVASPALSQAYENAIVKHAAWATPRISSVSVQAVLLLVFLEKTSLHFLDYCCYFFGPFGIELFFIGGKLV